MSFLKNAQLLIPEISGLTLTVWDKECDVLKTFEQNFCFLPMIQPLYTVGGLRSFFSQKEKNCIYEITDALDTHVIIMNTEKNSIILGPYTTMFWNENTARILLSNCRLQADKLMPYKVYRCSLPSVPQYEAANIAALLLKNVTENPNLEPIYVDMTTQKAEDIRVQIPEVYSESAQVYSRYAFEAQIIEAVRQGDTEQALKLFGGYRGKNVPGIGIRFLTNSLSDKIASTFALRVLVRHGAVQAGLTPIFVDALSQEYAQKMHRVKDESTLHNLMAQYITAFCKAVRENQKNDYSPYIKRALQYIELRLNQPITVEELCELNHISRYYFSQLFKKETGKTVKQYIMQVRCERAAELLENSSLPIQEVSRYVGYEDTNYFARIFKNLIGMSPQDYRKKKIMH